VFADAKEKHAMGYTHYRGPAKLKMQALLTFATMNLKKIARRKRKAEQPPAFSLILHGLYKKLNLIWLGEWGLFVVWGGPEGRFLFRVLVGFA